MNLQSKKTLVNGVEIPIFGLGVYKMTEPETTLQAIDKALAVGYRHIDTASLYNNEDLVGEAIRNSQLKREDIFVTTKVWNSDHGYDQTLRAFELSLQKLGLDYLDLYLTHWPVKESYVETYRAIERLYDEKLIRVPGVSNHHEVHLREILKTANVQPAVNQVECHPYLTQKQLHAFCKEQGIALTAWSPLGRGHVLEDEIIQQIGAAYGKTAAQVILRWHLQNDVIVIPKSVTLSRIEENAQIFDFELSSEDMQKIDALDQNKRFGQNPESFHFDF